MIDIKNPKNAEEEKIVFNIKHNWMQEYFDELTYDYVGYAVSYDDWLMLKKNYKMISRNKFEREDLVDETSQFSSH